MDNTATLDLSDVTPAWVKQWAAATFGPRARPRTFAAGSWPWTIRIPFIGMRSSHVSHGSAELSRHSLSRCVWISHTASSRLVWADPRLASDLRR